MFFMHGATRDEAIKRRRVIHALEIYTSSKTSTASTIFYNPHHHHYHPCTIRDSVNYSLEEDTLPSIWTVCRDEHSALINHTKTSMSVMEKQKLECCNTHGDNWVDAASGGDLNHWHPNPTPSQRHQYTATITPVIPFYWPAPPSTVSSQRPHTHRLYYRTPQSLISHLRHHLHLFNPFSYTHPTKLAITNFT